MEEKELQWKELGVTFEIGDLKNAVLFAFWLVVLVIKLKSIVLVRIIIF